MELGERIRRTRLRYGMSQAELARRVRISNTTMNQIELGKTPSPGVLIVRAIAQILHVSVDSLLGLTGDDPTDGVVAVASCETLR